MREIPASAAFFSRRDTLSLSLVIVCSLLCSVICNSPTLLLRSSTIPEKGFPVLGDAITSASPPRLSKALALFHCKMILITSTPRRILRRSRDERRTAVWLFSSTALAVISVMVSPVLCRLFAWWNCCSFTPTRPKNFDTCSVVYASGLKLFCKNTRAGLGKRSRSVRCFFVCLSSSGVKLLFLLLPPPSSRSLQAFTKAFFRSFKLPPMGTLNLSFLPATVRRPQVARRESRLRPLTRERACRILTISVHWREVGVCLDFSNACLWAIMTIWSRGV
mmetsp:Transcript_2779/g.5114  ORF Transcript_2779/g.5114 Transcript_2779/m.5114 type:complete len:277 (+) Transcript_2779:1017-1847(+)